ncbi:MAG: FliM/FliN family flagellar motor C-terminal domain-containing protein [Novosphingobium sp.]|nr:FliM/FliN family flagellar motor C-terminal domain-containing protein [Novosphingobium sp.]
MKGAMTGPVRPFLPPGALTSERVQRVLADVLAAWSRDCFMSAAVAVSCDDAARPALNDDMAETASGGAALVLTGPGKRCLIEQALGESLAGRTLCDADRQLLDAFAAVLADDLVARLDRLLEPAGGPAMRLRLMLGERTAGSLTVGRDAITGLVRKALPAGTDERAITSTRMSAIARVPVAIEGVLGRSQLSIEDANGLAAGDVLVLDRSLGGNAEIRAAGSGALIALGRLVPDSGRNTIRIAGSGANPGRGLD